MAEKYTQDPLAIFLEYQLPDMINEARRSKENRQHDFDMIKAREESSKRLAEFNAELGEEQATNETKLRLLISDRDRMIKNIETKRDVLLQSNINLEEYDLVKDKTEGGEALSTLIKSENMRESIKSLQDFQDLDQGINVLNDNLDYLNQTSNIIDRISAAQQQGMNFAKSVEDFDKDSDIDKSDFVQLLKNYQDLELKPRFDLSTAEGQLEHIAFMQQIPTLEEKFKIGRDHLDNKIKMKTLENAEIKNKREQYKLDFLASAGQDMGQFNNDVNFYLKLATEAQKEADKVSTSKYRSVRNLPNINLEKTELVNANEIDDLMVNVETTIMETLVLGTGQKAYIGEFGVDKINKLINKYNNSTTRAEKRQTILNLADLYYDKDDNFAELDYRGGLNSKNDAENDALGSQIRLYMTLSNGINFLPGYNSIYPPNESVEDARGLQ